MTRFRQLFPAEKTLIGMIHLPPLPDYPDSPGMDAILRHAIADLHVLEEAGFDGALIENEYDRPHRVSATAETIAAMTEVTAAVVAESRRIVVGCEILLNDPKASLLVAKMSGARFVRTDYFVDRMRRPEYGEFEIDPDGLINYRQEIAADDILILADIQVKYARMLEERSLAESARIAAAKQADAVVVSGDATGDAPLPGQLEDAASGCRSASVPVIIGSGLDPGNVASLLAACDGAIVGTALMRDGKVDPVAVMKLLSNIEGDK